MTAKIKFAGRINSANSVQNSVVPVPSGSNSGDPSSVKLPSMEFVKFDGDIRQWLTFWNCFKKIDENKNLSNVDKFQYLNQAMVSGSEADNLIKSYPLTAANYEKVLKGLKNRFGEDEILIEVYVRELLQLVLQKAINRATNVSLSSLYDKLVTHLRSLESLGVTTAKCAAMLLLLVESSLPEDLLRAWQRSDKGREEPADNDDASLPRKDRLTRLIEFIESEVKGELRISLAKRGFNLNNDRSSTRPRANDFRKTCLVP